MHFVPGVSKATNESTSICKGKILFEAKKYVGRRDAFSLLDTQPELLSKTASANFQRLALREN